TGLVQCDGYTGIQASLLVTSNSVPASDVFCAQIEGHGQHHNVVIFKNPLTGYWSIMSGNDTVRSYPTAHGPEEAIQQWANLNGDLVILYKVRGPDEKPLSLYHIRSAHNATRAGFDNSPGISQAMRGVQGTMRGLNDSDPDAAGANLAMRG